MNVKPQFIKFWKFQFLSRFPYLWFIHHILLLLLYCLFFSSTSKLWNSLSAYVFPFSYNSFLYVGNTGVWNVFIRFSLISLNFYFTISSCYILLFHFITFNSYLTFIKIVLDVDLGSLYNSSHFKKIIHLITTLVIFLFRFTTLKFRCRHLLP